MASKNPEKVNTLSLRGREPASALVWFFPSYLLDSFCLTTDKPKQQKFEFFLEGVGMSRREIFCSSDKEFIDE